MKLIKIPKKTEGELIQFFRKVNLEIVVKEYLSGKKNLNHGNIIKKKFQPYPPILEDLYKLFYVITRYKRVTCLEFGTGWSTLVMSHAMNLNKQKYLSKVKGLRFSNPFEIYSVDNIKRYLNISKKRINSNKNKVKFIYSENKSCIWNGQISNEYLKLPSVNPDFIYIDGPDHTYIDGKLYGIEINKNDFMPMNNDVLKIEHFLTPGTIILIDGRTSNANFLKNNLKRNWSYTRDEKRDHSIFVLRDKPIGNLNKNQISFYFG